MIELKAPGKVFLAGEYSVMTPGQPALIMAVDRHLTVFRSDSARFRIEIPRWGLDLSADESGSFETDGTDPRRDFIIRLLNETRALVPGAAPVHLVADMGPKDLLSRDLGLGTSAAWSVIFARSLMKDTPWDSKDTLEVALRSHSAAQGGRGSGADVATAWAGRSIRFVRSKTTTPSVTALAEPPRFLARILYSGTSQRTGPAVKKYEALAKTRPAALQNFVAQNNGAVRRMEEVLADPPKVVAAIKRANRALTYLANQMGISAPTSPWMEQGLNIIKSAVKPCGALGGDCMLAATAFPRYLPELESLAISAGYEVLPIRPIFGAEPK